MARRPPTKSQLYRSAFYAVLLVLVWLLVVAVVVQQGFLEWGIQQVLLMTFLLGGLKTLRTFPGFSHLYKIAGPRIEKRIEKGKRLTIWQILGRVLPPFNLIFIMTDFVLIGPILLIGMPIDITLAYLFREVQVLPPWGAAARMTMGQTIGFEFLLTLLAFPYVLMIATSFRALRSQPEPALVSENEFDLYFEDRRGRR